MTVSVPSGRPQDCGYFRGERSWKHDVTSNFQDLETVNSKHDFHGVPKPKETAPCGGRIRNIWNQRPHTPTETRVTSQLTSD